MVRDTCLGILGEGGGALQCNDWCFGIRGCDKWKRHEFLNADPWGPVSHDFQPIPMFLCMFTGKANDIGGLGAFGLRSPTRAEEFSWKLTREIVGAKMLISLTHANSRFAGWKLLGSCGPTSICRPKYLMNAGLEIVSTLHVVQRNGLMVVRDPLPSELLICLPTEIDLRS